MSLIIKITSLSLIALIIGAIAFIAMQDINIPQDTVNKEITVKEHLSE